MTKRVYLDNNATTQTAPSVIEAMVDVMQMGPCNASSTHHYGQKGKQRLLAARELVAQSLGVTAREITFTSGATEALNLLIYGFLGASNDGHVITSVTEHAAVVQPLRAREAQGLRVSFLGVDEHGAVTPEQVQEALRPDTKLIVLMAANNETGVKTDYAAIAEIALEARVPFVVDGVALMGKEPFSIPAGVSAMTFSGHKFHGPQGTGFFFLRKGKRLHPLFMGGGQEHSRRPGTENLPGIVGLAEAVRLVDATLPEATEHMRRMRDQLEATLIEQVGAVVNGTGPRTPNTSSLSFPGVDGETLLMSLDIDGVSASHGSACSAGSLQPSRVLLAMGYDHERTRSSLRFSVCRDTTEEDVVLARQRIVAAVERLSMHSTR